MNPLAQQYPMPGESDPRPLRSPAARGFSRADLASIGAIGLAHIPAPTLTNSIHPLFHGTAFEATPPQTYAQLRPALQLASLFLTHPPLRYWWIHLMLGPKRWSAERARLELLPLDVPTLQHHDAASLAIAAQTLVIRWAPLTEDIYGSTRPHPQHSNISLVLLRQEVREHIESGALAAAPWWQQMTFHFFFAINLMHELAHALLARRCDGKMGGQAGETEEPFLGALAFEREAGNMWERSVFGAKVQTVNFSPLADEGIMAYAYSPWPHSAGRVMEFSAASLPWVAKFFAQESWDQQSVEWMRVQLDCVRSRVPFTREVRLLHFGAYTFASF